MSSPLCQYVLSSYRVFNAGYSPADYVPWYVRRQPFDPGEYDAKDMENLVQVRASLDAIAHTGGRVRLDAFGVAAAVLGVRAALRKVRSAGIESAPTQSKIRVKKLLSKLEKYRKRAKRAFIARSGRAEYASARTRWKRFLRWVRVTLLGTGRWPTCAHRRLIFQLMLKEWMAIAREGLLELDRPIPPEPELKRFMRLALRESRRRRVNFSPKYLLRDRDFGRGYLADFVRDRYKPCQVAPLTDAELAAMFKP
jgi:hypothetical protein